MRPRPDSADPQDERAVYPLSFLCQINLRDVPEPIDGLPESGLLSFFYGIEDQPWGYDPADRNGWLVQFFDRDQEFSTALPPEQLSNEFRFRHCEVEFEPEMTLPDWSSLDSMTDAEGEEYLNLQEQLVGSSGAMHHRLLGHPQVIQNPMELECQLASNGIYCGNSDVYRDSRFATLRAGAADWRLLLQLDSDEASVGWMWVDVGRLYFWIRTEDLQELRFDRAWVCLQCY